jgi:PAS domain S-box-containing protein
MGIAKDKKLSAAKTKLRRRAEARLGAKRADLHPPRSEKDAKRLVHELEVHQIELEMQNAELRRAQEELELSRNKYVGLYDFAPIGYFTLDTRGLILQVNLTGAKLLGTERKLLLKKPFINFIGQAAEREIFSKHREDVLKKQGNQTCEIRLKKKNGVAFYAQLQSIAMQNIDDKVCDIHTTIIDITILKNIEAALQENDRRLNHAQEIAHLGSWDMDLLTDRLTWSDEAYRIFGFQPQEQDITYETFLDVVHPDDRAAVDAAYTDSVRKNRDTYEIEHRVVRKSTGEIRTVHERCEHTRDASGRIIRSIGMTHDITEHKKAEERIEHLASFPELNPNPVIETDIKGKIIYCNAATKRMLKTLDIPDDDIRIFLPHDLTKIIKEQEQEQEQEGRYTLREVEISGRVFIESIIVPANLRVARIYAQEITKRKQAEDALQKAHDGLELKVDERTVELKTALTEIEAMKDRLEAENIYFRQENKMKQQFENIIGQSDGLKYVLYRAQQVAPMNTTVLILGETGTGKELIAAAIHNMSTRKERPLITVNCAALPGNLIESELFGREKGAFTGADVRRMGRFEVANGSTLCLDEIGELPLELQGKLLRVIQHNEFERLGSSHTIKVDVRIIATTNRDLEEEVRNGRFRQDLYYRLNVFPITVPPLRLRKDDIPLMVRVFMERYSRKLGKQITTIKNETMKALQDYPWPGNVRELESIIERAVILCPGSVLQLADKLEISSPALASAMRTLEDTERSQILKILTETKWRIEGKDGAAAILGIHPSTLRARLHKLEIARPETKEPD